MPYRASQKLMRQSVARAIHDYINVPIFCICTININNLACRHTFLNDAVRLEYDTDLRGTSMA
jgi:hypothetical protein